MAGFNTDLFLQNFEEDLEYCFAGRRENKELFGFLMSTQLELAEQNIPVVPLTNLSEYCVLQEYIESYETAHIQLTKKIEEKQAISLDVKVQFFGSLSALIAQSNSMPELNGEVGLKAFTIILEHLGFHPNDTKALEDPKSLVYSQRYAKMSIDFLHHIVNHLHRSTTRQRYRIGASLLYGAVEQGSIGLVKHYYDPLAAMIPCVHAPNLLYAAIDHKDLITIEYLFSKLTLPTVLDSYQHSTGLTALHKAAVQTDSSILEALLLNMTKEDLITKINCNTKGGKKTPMHKAVDAVNLADIKLLCKYGAVYNLLDENDQAPAETNTDMQIAQFFNQMKTIFHVARSGNSKEFKQVVQQIDFQDRLAFLRARDKDTGMSAEETFFEQLIPTFTDI